MALESLRGTPGFGDALRVRTQLLDPKILDKPGKFHGKQDHWKDWSESMQAFCDVVDSDLGEAMGRYAKCENPVLLDDMSESDKTQSKKLHYILVMLTKDDAAQKRRSIIERGNGLEAWRVFFSEWEPALQNRFGNLLLEILNTRFKGASISEVEDWEAKIREYEGSATDKVAPNIRSATVLNGLPKDSRLLDHLTLNADRYPTWELMRKAIGSYFLNRKTWRSGAGSGPSPMDIDALDKGKGKTKDKGKGKWDKDKGKWDEGKGAAAKKKAKEKEENDRKKKKGEDKDGKSGPETRTCYGCGEAGHLRQNCPKEKTKAAGTGAGTGGSSASGKEKGVDALTRVSPSDSAPWIFEISRAETKKEKAQQGRSRKSGAGKFASGVDTNNYCFSFIAKMLGTRGSSRSRGPGNARCAFLLLLCGLGGAAGEAEKLVCPLGGGQEEKDMDYLLAD